MERDSVMLMRGVHQLFPTLAFTECMAYSIQPRHRYRDTDVGLLLVLEGKSNTGSDWDLRSDDSVAAIEVVLCVVVMHGSTLALARSSGLLHHLG